MQIPLLVLAFLAFANAGVGVVRRCEYVQVDKTISSGAALGGLMFRTMGYAMDACDADTTCKSITYDSRAFGYGSLETKPFRPMKGVELKTDANFATLVKKTCHDVESYGSSKVLVGLFGMEDSKAVTLLTGGMKEGDRFKFTGTYSSTSDPITYAIRKDASNVNFQLTITSTSQTINMKTKVGGTDSAAMTPEWVPLVSGEEVIVVVDILKAAFEVSINGMLLSGTLPASTLAHSTAVQIISVGGTNGYVVTRADHYRLKDTDCWDGINEGNYMGRDVSQTVTGKTCKPWKTALVENTNCAVDQAVAYRGTQSTTIGGYTCQAWNVTTPVSSTTSYYKKIAGFGDHNYCRAKTTDAPPWCYTTTPSVRWQRCHIPQCDLCAQYKINYWGGDVTTVTSTTFTKCVAAMNANAASDMYTYDWNSKTCYLKDWTKVAPRARSDTLISGFKSCYTLKGRPNIAYRKPTRRSSEWTAKTWLSDFVTDGSLTSNSGSLCYSSKVEAKSWITINLGRQYTIGMVRLYIRTGYAIRIQNTKLYMCEVACTLGATVPATVKLTGPTYYDATFAQGLTGSSFKMTRANPSSSGTLTFCELELYEEFESTNYCRDYNSIGYPWCMTTADTMEYCSVPVCNNLLRLTYDMRPYGKKSRMDGTDTRIIAQSTGTETCLLHGAKCTGGIRTADQSHFKTQHFSSEGLYRQPGWWPFRESQNSTALAFTKGRASHVGQMSYEVALTGKSCDETCQGVSAFCVGYMTASMALWHAFNEQGLQCNSIVNITLTKEMPYRRTSDGVCVGILNIPSAFDCSATIATANRLCQCITVELRKAYDTAPNEFKLAVNYPVTNQRYPLKKPLAWGDMLYIFYRKRTIGYSDTSRTQVILGARGSDTYTFQIHTKNTMIAVYVNRAMPYTDTIPMLLIDMAAPCDTDGDSGCVLAVKFQFRAMVFYFNRGPTSNRQITPLGKITLKDSQFRLQDLKEIYTNGNDLNKNIIHKILVKGGYDNSILSFSPFDDKYFGMMDISGSAVSGMWANTKPQQFANYSGSWSSISNKMKISVIDPLWCGTPMKATGTYATAPTSYNSYATATKACHTKADCISVVYKAADETWTVRKGPSILDKDASFIDYKYCRPSPQGQNVQKNYCPFTHPYVYTEGSYCCKTQYEKDGTSATCSGNRLTWWSKCCNADAHTACPTKPCSDYHIGVPKYPWDTLSSSQIMTVSSQQTPGPLFADDNTHAHAHRWAIASPASATADGDSYNIERFRLVEETYLSTRFVKRRANMFPTYSDMRLQNAQSTEQGKLRYGIDGYGLAYRKSQALHMSDEFGASSAVARIGADCKQGNSNAANTGIYNTMKSPWHGTSAIIFYGALKASTIAETAMDTIWAMGTNKLTLQLSRDGKKVAVTSGTAKCEHTSTTTLATLGGNSLSLVGLITWANNKAVMVDLVANGKLLKTCTVSWAVPIVWKTETVAFCTTFRGYLMILQVINGPTREAVQSPMFEPAAYRADVIYNWMFMTRSGLTYGANRFPSEVYPTKKIIPAPVVTGMPTVTEGADKLFDGSATTCMKVESSIANWHPSVVLTFTQRVEITKIDLVLTTDATEKAKSAGIKVTGDFVPFSSKTVTLTAIPANVAEVSMYGLYGYGIFTKVLNITQASSTKLIVCDIKIEISIQSRLSTLQTWLPTYSVYLYHKSVQLGVAYMLGDSSKRLYQGPIKCYGQFNIPHEPATLEKYSKECGKVIDKEVLYYKANTAAIGKSDPFVGFMTDFLEGDVIEVHFWAQSKSAWSIRMFLHGHVSGQGDAEEWLNSADTTKIKYQKREVTDTTYINHKEGTLPISWLTKELIVQAKYTWSGWHIYYNQMHSVWLPRIEAMHGKTMQLWCRTTTCLRLYYVRNTNYAYNKPTRQVSTYNGGFSGYAVDGNANNSGLFSRCSRTANTTNPWWQVDLQAKVKVAYVKIIIKISDWNTDYLKAYVSGKECSGILKFENGTEEYMLNCDYSVGCDVKIVAHYTTILMLCEVQVYGEKVGDSKQCFSLTDTEPDAPIENDGCYYDRAEKKTMAALSTTHTFPSLRNASVYCTPEYSNKALNRPIFAASGMVNSEGVLVDGNRLPNVITSGAKVGSQCATSKNAKAGEIIYIRLRDTYPISHVLVYGGVSTMDGVEVRAGKDVLCGVKLAGWTKAQGVYFFKCPYNQANYVQLKGTAAVALHLCEIEVYALFEYAAAATLTATPDAKTVIDGKDATCWTSTGTAHSITLKLKEKVKIGQVIVIGKADSSLLMNSVRIDVGGYMCGRITSIISGSTQYVFYCQGIFTDSVVISKLSAFTVCEILVYGMPECDGVVYNPTTKQYGLATGAEAASTTGHITYKKSCSACEVVVRNPSLIRDFEAAKTHLPEANTNLYFDFVGVPDAWSLKGSSFLYSTSYGTDWPRNLAFRFNFIITAAEVAKLPDLWFKDEAGKTGKLSMAGKADFITKFGSGNVTYEFTEKKVRIYFDGKVGAVKKWTKMKYQMKGIKSQGWEFYNNKARWDNLYLCKGKCPLLDDKKVSNGTTTYVRGQRGNNTAMVKCTESCFENRGGSGFAKCRSDRWSPAAPICFKPDLGYGPIYIGTTPPKQSCWYVPDTTPKDGSPIHYNTLACNQDNGQFLFKGGYLIHKTSGLCVGAGAEKAPHARVTAKKVANAQRIVLDEKCQVPMGYDSGVKAILVGSTNLAEAKFGIHPHGAVFDEGHYPHIWSICTAAKPHCLVYLGPNLASTVSGETIQFYKYSAAKAIPVVIWGAGSSPKAKWVNDKDDLPHDFVTAIKDGNVTATAPSLNDTYDNSVWVLNDPTCMVKKVRLFFTGYSNHSLAVIGAIGATKQVFAYWYRSSYTPGTDGEFQLLQDKKVLAAKPVEKTVNVTTSSVYVAFDLKITSDLQNAKIKIQVVVTVGTAKTVYDTDDIPVGTMELLTKSTYVTAKMYTEASMKVTMKSSVSLPYQWWNLVTGLPITDKTRLIEVASADGKILKLSFPNVTAADYGVYIVGVPLDGESIDSAGISLRQVEFLSASGACGNVGEDVDLSVKVQAQYLPTPAALTWQNLAGDKLTPAALVPDTTHDIPLLKANQTNYPICFIMTVDLSGADGDSKKSKTVTANGCLESCNADTACLAMTYTPSTTECKMWTKTADVKHVATATFAFKSWCTALAQNVAYLGSATSSDHKPKAYPERVIDGNTNGATAALSTNVNSPDKYGYAWCKVSFKYQAVVTDIILFTTTEATARLKDTEVWLGSTLLKKLTANIKVQRVTVTGTKNAAYVYLTAKSTKTVPALMNLAEVIVIGTFWTKNMTSTATLKKLTTDNDGQIYFAQIKGEDVTSTSGNASVSILQMAMMTGKDKVFTLVGGNINMTCRLTSKSATTIAPVSIYYIAEPSTDSSEISVQIKNSKTSVLCWAPSNTPTFEGDTLKLSICSKVPNVKFHKLDESFVIHSSTGMCVSASAKTVKAGTTLVLKADCTLSYWKLPKSSGIIQFLNHTVKTFCIATSADPKNNEVLTLQAAGTCTTNAKAAQWTTPSVKNMNLTKTLREHDKDGLYSDVIWPITNATIKAAGRYQCVAACGIKAMYSKPSDLGILSVQTGPKNITGVEKDTVATLTAVLTIPTTFDSKLEPLPTDYTIVDKDSGYKPPIKGTPEVSFTASKQMATISLGFIANNFNQSGGKYIISVNFTKLVGFGSLNTSYSIVVIQFVNNSKAYSVGVPGGNTTVGCLATDLYKATSAHLFKCKGSPLPWKNPATEDCDDTAKLSETTEGVFNSKTSITTFLCNITKLDVSNEGYYRCIVIMSGNIKRTTVSATYAKLLHFDFPPPAAFAGPRGGAASLTCQVSFPETDAMSLQDPTITWFQWDTVGKKTAVLAETDSAEASATSSKTLIGVNRTMVSTFTVGETKDENQYIAKLVYPDFKTVTINSSLTQLVILDVNMTRASFEGVINSDVQLTCAGYDAVKVTKIEWYKSGVKYTGDAKRIEKYNADRTRTEAMLVWLGVTVADAGSYYCGITFVSGYKMTAAESTGIKTASLTVLRLTKAPPSFAYITPGFTSNITCTFIMPETITTPATITWTSKDPVGTYNETSGARVEGVYVSVLTTPIKPVVKEGTTFAVRVMWNNISTIPTSSKLNDQNSTETKVKLRTVKLKKLMYDHSVTINDYYAIIGANLRITCNMESNEIVPDKKVKWKIDSVNITFGGEDFQMYELVPSAFNKDTFTTTSVLLIKGVTKAIDGKKVDCGAEFEDSSFIWASDDTANDAPTISIGVLYVVAQPIAYGFQRQNGISQDISAKFKVAAESGYLVYTVEWLSSSTAEGKKDLRVLTSNQFNHSYDRDYLGNGIVTTYLLINVTTANANKMYWPRITFDTLAEVQAGGVTSIATNGKIMLLISELCDKKQAAKLMKFPPGTYNSMTGVTYEVGDLIQFHGVYNASFKNSAGEPVTSTTFHIRCSSGEESTKDLLKIVANGLTAQYEITKYDGACTGTEEKTYKIDFEAKAVSRIVIIATEDKFLVWSTKATRANNIEIPYTITTPANTETEAEAVYSKDYLAIKAFDTPAGSSYDFICLTVCPTERETKLWTDSTKMSLTGIVQIQWIGDWGVVCDNDWDMADAKVVCRTIGNDGGFPIFGLGKTYDANYISSYSVLKNIWIDYVDCNDVKDDKTKTIYKCKHNGWDQVTVPKKSPKTTCKTENYAGVQCLKEGFGGIRIYGEYDWTYRTNLSGILHIKYNDTWGTLCSNTTWDRYTASALCLSMGHGYGAVRLVDLELSNMTLFWEDTVHSKVKTPLVWLDELDQKTKVVGFDKIATKGPWGRPLTKYAKCGINKTIYLDCEARLQCYSCESANETGCFNQTNMQVVTCNEDVRRCYRWKNIKKDGTVYVKHGCMFDTQTEKYSCENIKSKEGVSGQPWTGCDRDGDDKMCFCKQCYGRLCNTSPVYKVAAAMSNAVTGSMSGIMYLIDVVTQLIRIGMFDASLMSATNTTNGTT